MDGVISTQENTAWFAGEPNDGGGPLVSEDCVVINWIGQVNNTANDFGCDSSAFALCEMPLLIIDDY